MRPPARQFGVLAQPLDAILGAPARVRILRALDQLEHPLSVVGLQAEAGLTHRGALNAVAALVATGIVAEEPIGRSSVYRLADNHPFAPALRQLFHAERRRRRAIPDAVEGWAETVVPAPLAVWLFGSAARREDTFRSDIDLAVVARTPDEAQQLGDSLRSTLTPVAAQHALRPTVVPYDAAAVVGMAQADPPMWEALARDGIALFGPDSRRLRTLLMNAA
jgi:DNA-binding transcriptional ArsR family regulator